MNRLLLTAFATLPLVASATVPAELTHRQSGLTRQAQTEFSVSDTRARKVKAATAAPRAGQKTPVVRRTEVFFGNKADDVQKYGTLELLASEDFSLLTFGSETELSDEQLDIQQWLTDEYGNILFDKNGNPMENPEFQYPWNNMRRDLTHEPGWGIGGAKSAGGMVSMTISRDNPEAHVVTPVRDFTINPGGIAVCEFRAKAAPGTSFSSILVENAETYNWAPSWDFPDDPVQITDVPDTWTTYRVLIQGAGASTIFNIVAMGTGGQVFMDDVKVYSVKPFVEIPETLRHKNFSDGQFTARWKEVPGADRYLVNCYYADEYTGDITYVAGDLEVTGTEHEFTGLNSLAHYYTVRAVKGDYVSVESKPRMVYDIVTPEFFDAEITDTDSYVATWDEVTNAFGFNYMAMAKRTAEQDGEFVITDMDFSDLVLSDESKDELAGYGYEWPFNEDNPCDMSLGYFYPEELRQNGWRGENYLPYDGFLKLDGWWTNRGQQSGWISPEFDLSKDNGNVKVRMNCASRPALFEDADGNLLTVYSQPCVALFNYDEEIGDYSQVELQYLPNHPEGVKADWVECEFNLTKGGKRSVIGIFAVYGEDDLYIDDLKITQNYKKGESFMDPFCFRYYQLKGSDEVTEEKYMEDVSIPDYVGAHPIYDKVQAVRALFSEPDFQGNVSKLMEQASDWTEDHFVMDFAGSGIECVRDVESDGETSWYDLQGRPVSGRLLPGLYLKRQGENTEKVIVK